MTKPEHNSSFYVELIQPSRYDDDGYVVQWWQSRTPSNSLATMYGLALEAADRQLLGDDVEIVIRAYDESNTVLPISRIARRLRGGEQRGIVCLVGVQSNQFPRALDIARELRAADIQVAIGGFHVSGCVAMLPEMPPEMKEAMEMGVALFAGEGEGHLDVVLEAAYERRLEPLYRFIDDLPDLSGAPTPFLPARHVRRYVRSVGCFDAGRGCPFACSFCTIINVQGRRSRWRDADDVERILRAHWSQGIEVFFITDDNFARNVNWEPIFDRMIELRENEGLKAYFLMQVDTLCHRIPNFIEKAKRAGCRSVFIGLENIDPENLKAAGKGQNHITEYRRMLQAWQRVGVITYCGYILGFPADTPESIRRSIKIIQRELPLHILEFFILTPLPGSQDHKTLYLEGTWMDPDLNKYDLEHVTTEHPRMTKEELASIYDEAWHLYYGWDHIETLLRRAVAIGDKAGRMVSFIFDFYASYRFERLHPLQSGIWRRKVRTQRRAGIPVEPVVRFYPRRIWEILTGYSGALAFLLRLLWVWWSVERDPKAKSHRDVAITPVTDEAYERLDLFEVTDAARREVAKVQNRAEIVRRVHARQQPGAG